MLCFLFFKRIGKWLQIAHVSAFKYAPPRLSSPVVSTTDKRGADIYRPTDGQNANSPVLLLLKCTKKPDKDLNPYKCKVSDERRT